MSAAVVDDIATNATMPMPTLGLLAPLTPIRGPSLNPLPDDELGQVLRSGLVDALWLRDLPVAPAADDDAGQGTDPFVHLAHLAGTSPLPPVVGIASVIAGTRHPLVLARQAMTVQGLTGGRLVLGVGTGGKPAMNAALGIGDRSMSEFADEWWAVRRALAGDVGDDVRLDLPTPCQPPPLYLATTDTERWRAVDGDPDGWLAFAGEQGAFCAQLDEMSRISGRTVPAAVRIDATITTSDAGPPAAVPRRGRFTGTIDQLVALLDQWRQMPISHLLLNVRSSDPLRDLRHLRQG